MSKIITDQIGRNIVFDDQQSLRIVSLVPSLTELLVDLGLSSQIVGLTTFCVHPLGFKKTKTIVGGTKKIRVDKIKALNPTFILANKEENTKEAIEELASDFAVYVSDIQTIDDLYNLINHLGQIFQIETKAKELIIEIKNAEKDFIYQGENQTFCYFIWNNPLMIAGKSTFIDYLLTHYFHWKNASRNERYPQISLEELVEMKPDILLLSSEPYPFDTNHIQYFQQLLPASQIFLVDGEMFSWYGSRMKYAFAYFQDLVEKITNRQ